MIETESFLELTSNPWSVDIPKCESSENKHIDFQQDIFFYL